MELWLDTADLAAISQASKLGIFYGVTTNPSIFARARMDEKQLIAHLLQEQPGLLALQVTQVQDAKAIVSQALDLSSLSDRIVVKIPATPIGFAAMHVLKKQKVPVLATAISSISQFVFSALAGADYAALYLSHMMRSEKDILAQIEAMLLLTEKHHWTVKLMGAAFTDAKTTEAVIATGVHSVTLPEAIVNELLAIDPYVQQQFKQFDNDWQYYQTHYKTDFLST
jgi:TalC/MipB family fructose-6-phosphate aldolase